RSAQAKRPCPAACRGCRPVSRRRPGRAASRTRQGPRGRHSATRRVQPPRPPTTADREILASRRFAPLSLLADLTRTETAPRPDRPEAPGPKKIVARRRIAGKPPPAASATPKDFAETL